MQQKESIWKVSGCFSVKVWQPTKVNTSQLPPAFFQDTKVISKSYPSLMAFICEIIAKHCKGP